MDLKWNLDNIYTSFESENFKSDMNKLKKYIDVINEFDVANWEKDESCFSKIEEFLELNNEYKKIYSKVYSYAYLIMSVDSQNV